MSFWMKLIIGFIILVFLYYMYRKFRDSSEKFINISTNVVDINNLMNDEMKEMEDELESENENDDENNNNENIIKVDLLEQDNTKK
jgi:hypothetical protein